jgi:D-alanyl-D-alanine carboxypeptidase-like protein
MLPIVLLMAAITPQFAEKMRMTTWRPGCPVAIEQLREVTVKYRNFENETATGMLIVHQDVAGEVAAVFDDLYAQGFQIERIAPVEEYQGDDDASMAANNTSAFNCRAVTGKPGMFSNHSWGRAIDINPLINPYVKGDKISPPEGRRYLDRTVERPGLIRADSFIVKRFLQAGWQWGGSWSDPKDYQHFEKRDRAADERR